MRRQYFGGLAVYVAGAIVGGLLTAPPAMAARRGHHRHAVRATQQVVYVRTPLYRAVLVEDADTGQILYQYNTDMEWPPASMAKMMLLLVAEDEIKAGHCAWNDPVRISERAAYTGGSHIGLRAGEVYPLGELIKAALIRSANDAAVAVAEKVGGSVEACVRMMNERAQNLSMTHTLYNTVDGLPPRAGQDVDVTNANDLATLARELIKHTDLLQWSGMQEALFNGGEAILHNTNHLVGRFEGCDGLKTGFTYQAGFNLTATAKRGAMRLVAVVLGAPSNRQRFEQAARFMEWGFDHFTKVALLKPGEQLPVHVQVNPGQEIQPIVQDGLEVLVPRSKVSQIKVDYDMQPSVSVPLASGDPVGQVIVRDGSEVLARAAAVSPVSVGTPGNLMDNFKAEGISVDGSLGPTLAAHTQPHDLQ